MPYTCPISSIGDAENRDPFPFYDDIRAAPSLYRDEKLGAWLVSRHAECREVLLKEDVFRHPYSDATEDQIAVKGGRRNITLLQGDNHAKMHRLLLGMFTPRYVEGYRSDHIVPVINWLFARLEPEAELVAGFTEQLPTRVILSLMGLNWRDDELADEVLQLHSVIAQWISGIDRDRTTAPAKAASRRLNELLLPSVIARQASASDDLIGRLWAEACGYFPDFTEDDILANCRELLLAGADTTVHALTNSFYLVMSQPALQTQLRLGDEALLVNFVEETMRIYGSAQYRLRIAAGDGEIGGTRYQKGDLFVVLNAAANRDPDKYECPAEFRFGRKNPRDHLGFNTGPRVCVGAALARAEMVEALRHVLRHTEWISLATSRTKPTFRFNFTRSFQPLNSTLQRAEVHPV